METNSSGQMKLLESTGILNSGGIIEREMYVNSKVTLLIIYLSPLFLFTVSAGPLCSQQGGTCYPPPCPADNYSLGKLDCGFQICCRKYENPSLIEMPQM